MMFMFEFLPPLTSFLWNCRHKLFCNKFFGFLEDLKLKSYSEVKKKVSK